MLKVNKNFEWICFFWWKNRTKFGRFAKKLWHILKLIHMKIDLHKVSSLQLVWINAWKQNKYQNKNHWTYLLLCSFTELTIFDRKLDKKRSWFSNNNNFSNCWSGFPLASWRVFSPMTSVNSGGNTITTVFSPSCFL